MHRNTSMEKTMRIILQTLISLLLLAHSATLTFTKSADDIGALSTGYTAYRAPGTCPAIIDSAQFTVVNSSIIHGTSYTDMTVTPGVYCYFMTFSIGAESVPSNAVTAIVQPAAPTNPVITNVN